MHLPAPQRRRAAARLAVGALALTTAWTGLAGPAGAAPAGDGGPDLEASAVPAVGEQVGPSNLRNETFRDDYTDVPYIVSWRSDSEVERYDIWAVYAGVAPREEASYGGGPEEPAALLDTLRDYYGDYGGGSFDQVGWRVDAVAADDEVTSQDVGRRPRVIQENGASPNSATHAVVTRGPAWRRGACTCASGGQRVFTKKAGAPVRVVLDEGWNADAGTELGLVVTQGPRRGKVAIFVDGRRRTVLDTYAPERRDRVLAWTGVVPAGVPVVVRNQRTPGRPRTDVDAFVLF